MKQLEQFKTKEAANKGVRLDLTDLEGGETEHWLQIKGTDSDTFRKAMFKAKQKLISQLDDNDEVTFEQSEKDNLELLASLVSSWSFKDDDGKAYPCTKRNIVEFLTEAPQIADKINEFSAKRSLFTKSKSKISA